MFQLLIVLCASVLTFGMDSALAQSQSAFSRSPWQGPYIGMTYGVEATSHGNLFATIVTENKSGFVGYNHAFSNWVIGAEAEVITGGPYSVSPVLKARLGYDLGPILFYASIGYLWNDSHTTTRDARQFEDLYPRKRHGGIDIGGGAEVALNSALSLRAEARVARFERHSVGLGPIFVNPTRLDSLDLKTTDFTTRLGFVYRPNDVGLQAPGKRWDGWSAGVHGHFVLRDNTDLYSGLQEFPAVPDVGTFGRTGFSAGYAWQWGSIVFAPEARVGFGEDKHWHAALAGRLGYAFGPSLLYGLAGYQSTQATLTDLRAGERVSARHSGLVVGAGIDTMVTRNVSIRLEATSFDAGTETYRFNGSLVRGRPSRFIGSPPQDAGFRDMNLSLGATWHFN